MADERIYVETSEEWELFLLGLRYRQARLITLSGNEPFLLAHDQAWVIYKGTVDVFAVRLEDSEAVGARHHLFRADTNQLLLSTDLSQQAVGLLASCAPETQLLQLSQSQIKQLAQKEDAGSIIAMMVEDWVRALAAGVSPPVTPKEYQRIEAGSEIAVAAGQVARTPRHVLWVQHLAGRSCFMERDDLPAIAGDTLVPMSEHNWLQAMEDSVLQAFDTAAVLSMDPEWEHLAYYHQLTLELIAHDIEHEKQVTRQLIQDKVADDRRKIRTAFTQLASTWGEEQFVDLIATDSPDPLLAACRLAAQPLGITIRMPPDYEGLDNHHHPLADIARASRIRTRLVLLRDDWWRHDNGPLLAYRGEDRRPVALLPVSARRYELQDPATRERLPVDTALADTLGGTAHSFYRPLPERPLNALDLLRFGAHGTRFDTLSLLAAGILAGLLGILVPVVTGVVFGELIPSGDQQQLLLMGAVLAVSAIAVALFQIVRSIALLRIEGHLESAIQAAVWDRILNLPADFFRRYSAGDLTERAIGISYIKQILSSSVILAILSGLFSWFNVLLLFYYDAGLAAVATSIVVLSSAVTLAGGVALLRYQRLVTQKQGQIAGLIAQLVSGISKLRVAGAENRAFFLWAREFSEQKKIAFRARSAHNYLTIFTSIFPIMASMVIFATAHDRPTLSTGRFLAFNAAFTLFMIAGLQLSSALIAALSAIPIYERLKPILQALPEVDEQKANPGELSGRIEVNHVSFCYDEDGPLVLDDVTFSVRSGEFVALVGPSGSGKSTLLRHLLGFEKPDSGAIYFDGQALNEVDLRAVRRQIGVVLQHSQVMTGTIFDNIVGSSNRTIDDAWEAARQAGIDADIKQMPMGMQTYISEGGSTFSGGQRQRLLIARALVTRPRIIFFDEATSALDDRSQSLVTESLKQIDATRIVIAHRLSTIMDADRILVMDRGRVVESGTYRELIARDGVFARLAQRQLI